MDCPKCKNSLAKRRFGPEIQVMHCGVCGGMWCRRGMLERLIDQPLTEGLDAGANKEDYPRPVIFSCPDCNKLMEEVQHPDHPRVLIDRCESCNGIFLDAGELTNLKNTGVVGWLQDLLSR